MLGGAARQRLGWAVGRAIVLAGLIALVAAAFVAVVVVSGRLPRGSDWTLLGLSALAAGVCALAWAPTRARLERLAARAAHAHADGPDQALRAVGQRLTRALPLDELLLQLAETLRRSLALEAVEVWTGGSGLLERAASDPDRGRSTLVLSPAEQSVLACAGVAGSAWAEVWLPQLAAGRDAAGLRVAPVTSAGELLGLIAVERAVVVPFAAADERLLGELARQLGLTLRNVRLDSALEASLDELRRQAEELRVSRARVVSAADAERRRIERDLHDGAQQHLVGLVVNLRLARELADRDPPETKALLTDLGRDAKAALEQLRELAHGIYPPLLLDCGLAEALGAVGARAGHPVRVQVDGIHRYAPDVEATVYFCCLEALQNIAKHAGAAAHATVRVWQADPGLCFEVSDDGAGFAPGGGGGAGLENMRDRLGALGGRLAIASEPGHGTTVSGAIPLAR